MSLPDSRVSALRALGFDGALNNMMIEWAQSNGATSSQYNLSIIQALLANGATSSQFNTAWMEMLTDQGYTGNFNDMEKEFWENGGSFYAFKTSLKNSLIPERGTLNSFSTEDTAGEYTVTDFTGKVNDCLGNEARFAGADRVHNMVGWSTDLSTWTHNPSNTTKTDYYPDPFGGNTAVVVKKRFSVDAGITNQASYSVIDGEFYVVSVYVKPIANILPTTTVKFNVPLGFSISTEVDIYNLPVGEWSRLTTQAPIECLSSSNETMTLAVADLLNPDAEVAFACPQIERVSGKLNKAPSNFVPVGAGTEAEELDTTMPASNWEAGNNVFNGDGTVTCGASLTGQGNTAITLKEGSLYSVVYTISGYSTGSIKWELGDVETDTKTADGTYVEVIRCGASGEIELICGLSTVATLSNISIKEIDLGSNIDAVQYFDTVNNNDITYFETAALCSPSLPVGADVQQITYPETFDGWVSGEGNVDFTCGTSSIVGGAVQLDGLGVNVFSSVFIAEAGKFYHVRYDIDSTAATAAANVDIGGVVLPKPPAGESLSVDVVVYTASAGVFTIYGAGNVKNTKIDNVYITPLNKIPDDLLEGILVEDQKVNVVFPSEDIISWTKVNMGAGTANALVSPSGSIDADTIADDGSVGNKNHYMVSNNYSRPAASTRFSGSMYVKAGTFSDVQLRVSNSGSSKYFGRTFHLANETSSGSVNNVWTLVDWGMERITADGWYRIWVIGTVDAVADGTKLQVFLHNGVSTSYDASVTSGDIDVWGGQLEISRVPTTYIPTVSSAITRSGTSLSYALPDTLTGGALTEGSLFYTAKNYPTDELKVGMMLGAITGDYWSHGVTAGNEPEAFINDGLLTDLFGPPSIDGSMLRLGSNFIDQGDKKLYGNGALIDEDVVLDTAKVLDFSVNNLLHIGAADSGSFPANGSYKNILIYDKAISDEKMVSETS